MSIAGWELDSFALLRLMDYMQMIHSLLLLFDPSTPAVWKSTRDIFGWRWFFIIIIIIVPTHACIICTQTYIHTRMQANSLVMVLCSRTCWKQPCQKTGCFFSFGWICLPNCMALKKICFSANTSVKVVRVSFYSLTSPRVEGENERIFSSSFLNANFLILKALRARGHLKYLARHHAKGHCFSCNTSFSPAETIQPCALRPTTLLDSYFPSFHLLGVTDFHRFPSFFRLISLLFWLSFPSVALILSPLPETFIFLLLCEKAEVASSLLCSQLFVLLHIRALGLILQVDLSVSLSHFLSVFVSQGQSEAYSQTVEYVLLSVSNWSIWTLNRRGPIRVSGRQNWKSAILPLG